MRNKRKDWTNRWRGKGKRTKKETGSGKTSGRGRLWERRPQCSGRNKSRREEDMKGWRQSGKRGRKEGREKNRWSLEEFGRRRNDRK